MSPESRKNLGLALGLVGTVIFAATLPLTRLAVGDLGPWFITFGRAAGAGLIAALVLSVLRRPLPKRRQIYDLALVALLLCVGFAGLTGVAMQSLPAAHGGVVIGLLPLATAAASVLIAGERPSPAFWLCSAIGASLVIVYALRQGGGALASGDVLLLGAVVSAAFGYTISGKLSGAMAGWEVISWAVVIALPITLPASLYFWPADAASATAADWSAFAYLAAMSMYVGFFAWNAGLAMGGIARVSQVQLLQTFVTIALSAILVGETIDLPTIIFAALIAAVVFVGRKLRVATKPVSSAAA